MEDFGPCKICNGQGCESCNENGCSGDAMDWLAQETLSERETELYDILKGERS